MACYQKCEKDSPYYNNRSLWELDGTETEKREWETGNEPGPDDLNFFWKNVTNILGRIIDDLRYADPLSREEVMDIIGELLRGSQLVSVKYNDYNDELKIIYTGCAQRCMFGCQVSCEHSCENVCEYNEYI